MHEDSEKLTAEGTDREWLGKEGRAKDRAVKRSGGSMADYDYNEETNRTKRR